ncbi:MAG: efflux RND transporter periplasmic adaptor subunit [Pseudomonadota bacterium]
MRTSWIIALVIGVGAGAWIAGGVLLGGGDTDAGAVEAEVETVEEERPLPTVRIMESVAEAMTNSITLQGRTVADREVSLSAETDGPVLEAHVERGSHVSAGDLLARLAPEDRQARRAEAEALYRQREIEFIAAERLNQQGHASDTSLAQARAGLDSAMALVELSQVDLDRLDIVAPFDGIIEDRYVEVGTYVRAGDQIATILDLDPIRVAGEVSERHLGQIGLGTVAEVGLIDGRVVPGAVSFISAAASEATRTFRLEVEIPNPDGTIIQGLTAELTVPTQQVIAHRLSASVLNLADDGQVGVMAVNEDNVTEFLPIRIVGATADEIWVSGLPDTVSIVVVGQGFVQPGIEVEATLVDGVPNRPDATTTASVSVGASEQDSASEGSN